MSCASLLLYLELCVFIYRKLPYPKKTTLIWISGASPVGPRVGKSSELLFLEWCVVFQIEWLCFRSSPSWPALACGSQRRSCSQIWHLTGMCSHRAHNDFCNLESLRRIVKKPPSKASASLSSFSSQQHWTKSSCHASMKDLLKRAQN